MPLVGVGLETENEDVWWREDDEPAIRFDPKRLWLTFAIEVYDLEEQRWQIEENKHRWDNMAKGLCDSVPGIL